MHFMTNGGKFEYFLHHVGPSDIISKKWKPVNARKSIAKPEPMQFKYQLHKYLPSGNMRDASGPSFTTQIRWSKCNSGPPKVSQRDIRFPNFDYYRRTTKSLEPDEKSYQRKTFPYVMAFFGWMAGMYSAKSIVIQLVSVMAPSADVLAVASVEVDLSGIPEGKTATVKWRGKPLFIKHRTAEEIDHEKATPLDILRDPQRDEDRAQVPEWLVVIGICTHLGCVPIPDSGDFPGGFYCPCHGSHYDAAGRARKGPAPLNLEVPPYRFLDDKSLIVG